MEAEEHAATHSLEEDATPLNQPDTLDSITMAMEGLGSDNSLEAREQRRGQAMAEIAGLEGRLRVVLDALGFPKDIDL